MTRPVHKCLAALLLFGLISCDKSADLEEARILVKEKAVSKQAKELEERAKNPTPSPSVSPTPSPSESPLPVQTTEGLIDQVAPIETSTPEPQPVVSLSDIEEAFNDLSMLDSPEVEIPDDVAADHKYYTNDESPSAQPKDGGGGSQLKDLLGGVVTRTTPAQIETTDSSPSSKEISESKRGPLAATGPAPFVTGQPRGFVMLQAMMPEARRSVDKMVQTLLDARIRQVYLSVLMDGTFGKDLNYLALILRRLSFEQREVHLALYLTNGATMRDFENTNIDEGFNKINPSYFRELIRNHLGTRQRFSSMARSVRPILELNKNLNPDNRNYVIVMLEDNLDFDSYRAMRELAEREIGSLAQYIRNPCPGCFEGNDRFAADDRIELHRPFELSELRSGDGFTMDGSGYRFPGEGGYGISLPETEALIDRSVRAGHSYFGLWRAERQGLSPSVGSGERPHPSERVYEIPSVEQSEIEVRLLRHGLQPVVE